MATDKKLKIKAVAGKMLPMERASREYVPATAIEVPNTAYYRRAIRRGDVEEVTGGKRSRSAAKQDEAQGAGKGEG